MSDASHHEPQSPGSPHGDAEGTVEMPRPTAWPIVLAFGVILLLSGLLLNMAFAVVGAVAFVLGLGGWIHQLLPGVGEFEMEWVPAEQRTRPIQPATATVEQIRPGVPGHRMRMPIAVHPYSAGIKGGIVGGVAMGAMAAFYGVQSGRGLWYPVNLLAGMILPSLQGATTEELEQFQPLALAIGVAIHIAMSLGTGLFYGMILPTLPRWPVLWGGIVAPLLWTGAIYSFMGVLNPVLNEKVDWWWFVASQFAFGLAAGIVIVFSEKVPTSQSPPPAPAS